jgi:hypothetical protein
MELMAPILPLLSNLTESTRDQTLDKKEKVSRIKGNTLRIGDWIQGQDEGRKERFWEYLGHRCFNGSSAKSMRDIYGKMAAERVAKPVVVNGGSATNGGGGENGNGNGVKKETVVAPTPAPAPAATAAS